MSRRSRRRYRPQSPAGAATPPTGAPPPTSEPAGPECSLLEAIAAGELDDHLTALADAVDARLRLLHTVRQANALARLCVGDEVRVNHTVRPRYLHGAHGCILDIQGHDVTVRLHRPVGRFTSGQVRCSALALDRVSPAPTTMVA